MSVIDVTRERTIDADADHLWRLVTEVGDVARWAPVVPQSEWVGEPTSGVGGRRRCTFDPPRGRKWVLERVTESDDAARRQVVELVEGPARPPFERVEGITTVRAMGAERAAVTLTLRTTTSGPRQWLLARAGRPLLARTARRLLAGLDLHATTGREVSDVGTLVAEGVRI